MNHDIPLGRLRGIRVGMSWSVLLIAGFYVYILATYQFPNEAFDSTTAAYWIAGIVGALVFFLSLLVHEMSHALVARATGIEVRGITLWLLGGFAELGSEPDTPGKQFTIAVVGPISNLLLAAVFWLAHGLVATNPDPFAVNSGTSGLIAVVLGWLAFVNLLLGVFNLLPAAPLDGGQLFGAGVWAASGNRTVSRRWSAYAGIALGSAGVAYGLVTMNSQGTLNGIWLMIIGWWIAGIAWSEIRRLDVERNLAPVAVGDIMGPEPPMLPAQTTIDAALAGHQIAPDRQAFCAQEPDGRIVGVLTSSQIRHCDATSRATVPLGRLAFPIERVRCVAPETNALDLARTIADDPIKVALVLRADGRVVGTVGTTELGARARTKDRAPAGR